MTHRPSTKAQGKNGGTVAVVLEQKEMAIMQKELAQKMQHHFEVLQMRSEKPQHETELASPTKRASC